MKVKGYRRSGTRGLIQTACLFPQQQQPGIYNLGTDLCVNDAQRYRVTLFEVQIYEDYCGSCIGFMAPQVLSWRLWLWRLYTNSLPEP
jgi:hypothetical protein